MPNVTSPDRPPAYRRHKATGRAVVTIDGRDNYLGKHKSAASREAYRRKVGEWMQNGGKLLAPKHTASVTEIIVAYLEFADGYYRKDDKPTDEVRMLGRLNDVAEAFVLLYEIEHEIRDLICDVCDNSMVDRMIAELSLPPNSRRPESLGEFTFNQYSLLICSKNNWGLFEPMFDTMRALVNADFGEVNELRNIVFHFRRGITPKDTDRLRRFRERLRYDRELYAREVRGRKDVAAKSD